MVGRSPVMKKILVCVAGVICIMAALALATDTTVKETNQKPVLKQTAVKTAKMNARGKVVEISDKAVTIERSMKGNVEKMEFALEKPVAGIAVSDFVKIDYSVKEGKLTASRVVKLLAPKSSAKSSAKFGEDKSASGVK